MLVNGVRVCANGMRAEFDEPAVQRTMEADESSIEVRLGEGSGSAVVWTCDFTERYIRINADYRT